MNTILFIGGLGLQEIIFLVLIVLLFFGGKKIPELMKGIGKGVRSFKEGMNGIEDPAPADKPERQNRKQKRKRQNKWRRKTSRQ